MKDICLYVGTAAAWCWASAKRVASKSGVALATAGALILGAFTCGKASATDPVTLDDLGGAVDVDGLLTAFGSKLGTYWFKGLVLMFGVIVIAVFIRFIRTKPARGIQAS